MKVEIISCLQDNYSYLIIDETNNLACVVDPGESGPIIDYLKDKNIHTSVHYRPLHLFTQFRDESEFPVADKEWLRMITLPCHLNMTDEDIDYVIFWVQDFFCNFKN